MYEIKQYLGQKFIIMIKTGDCCNIYIKAGILGTYNSARNKLQKRDSKRTYKLIAKIR